ncbi:MAG: PAS domain S-box protein [Anaerolineales bacterium]|nr:PAS domain S-box protein [Anaerolineales bacterium]
MKRSLLTSPPLLVMLYGLFGVVWILFTDRLLAVLLSDTAQMVRWQTLKGWLFVALSMLLLAWILTFSRKQYRQTQEVLKRREREYRVLFENNPLPMWVYDEESLAFLAVNEAAVTQYGYSRPDFLNMTLKDIRPEEDIPRLLTDVAATFRPLNRAGEWRHRRRDGTVFPVEIVSHALAYEEHKARLVVAYDLTERQRTEQLRRESEERFRNAIKQAPFPIILHAEDGEVLTVNQTWMEITGYQAEELATVSDWTERAYGERQLPVLEGIDRLYDLNQRVAEGEFTITCRDGSQRIWEFSSAPLGPLPDGRRSVMSMAVDVTERKLAEARLHEVATELDGYFTNSLDLLCIADEDGYFRRLNKQWEETLGFSLDDLVGRQFLELVHPHDREKTVGAMQRLANHERVFDFVNRYRHRAGNYRWIEWRASQVGDAIYAAARDITEHIQNEQQLRLQSAALEAAANAIVIFDVDGRVEWVNPAFTEMTGYSREEALGRQLKGLVRSELHDQTVYDEMAEAILSGENWHGEIVNRRKDGTHYIEESSFTPVRDERGEIVHYVAIKQDVTSRRVAERERERLLAQVQAQAEQLTQIMQSVPEGILLLDKQNRILMANAQGQEYLALLGSQQVGDVLTHLGSLSLEALQTSPTTGGGHELATENGRIFKTAVRPIETTAIPDGWILVLRETTREQFVQRQLQQQEKLAAIGQLAAGIAHDFNNIMAVIILYAQLAEKAPDLGDAVRQRLNVIVQQANRAAALIQQILDFSHKSVMKRQPADLLALLQEQIELLQRMLPENIDIQFSYQPDEYIILADLPRIQQSIMNLAVNARDAMTAGGRLLIHLTRLTIPSGQKSPLPRMAPGEWIQLVIRDTGGGIAPDLLPRVFEPFFTTKKPGAGTGLGLAQVHGIITQHDGDIVVESQPGEGTTFTIYLPALKVEGELQTAVPDMTLPMGSGELLLIVEDQEPLRQALAESLAAWHYRTLTAANGEEALALLDQQEDVALVISDIIMPRMGGETLVKNIRQRDVQIPILLMSGHPLDVDMSKFGVLGVSIVLGKPIQPEQLARTVAVALGKNLLPPGPTDSSSL